MSELQKVKIGVIGCGNISGAYFGAAERFDILDVVACADINQEAAEAKSKEFNIPVMSVNEMLADPEIEIVVNLTIPAAHADIAMRTLKAGKHAYSEKPFGINLDEAKEIIVLAKEKNLLVGSAPDTFFGGGQQTSRKLIDDNWIGKVLSGTAMFLAGGPEEWHPNPTFFYQEGAGPMLDLGPYYITALINLLGPAKSVTAVTTKGFETRIGGAPSGRVKIPVEVTTHLTGMVEFASGAIVTVITSFDVQKHGHAPIEIYGTNGSIQVPDPNAFGGPVKIFQRGYEGTEWHNAPLSHIYTEGSRSIGVADMAYALRTGRKHRANGDLACHVLEVMLAFDKASEAGGKVELTTTCERPAALPLGLSDGLLDS
jgi:predicted dehydrogenase